MQTPKALNNTQTITEINVGTLSPYCPLPAKVLYSSARSHLQHAVLHGQQLIRKVRHDTARHIRALRGRMRRRLTEAMLQELDTLTEIRLNELKRIYQELMDTAHSQCLELSFSIAERVIQDEITQNPESLKNRIQQILREISSKTIQRISVHPHTVPPLEAESSTISPEHPITFDADLDITPGNARIHTRSGSIDLDWNSHFKTLTQELKTQGMIPHNEK